MVRLRFPSGFSEITYRAEEPKVGDRLTRGDDDWEVIAVGKDPNGNVVVTLGPSGGGHVDTQEQSSKRTGSSRSPHPRRDSRELVERAEAARTDSVALREHADDRRRDRRAGERIAKARQRAGLTQRDLAESLGVTIRTIQNYESGSSAPHRHLHRIAALTGATRGWILYGDEVNTVLTGRLEAVKKSLHRENDVLAHQLETVLEQTHQLDEELAKRRRR